MNIINLSYLQNAGSK